MGFLDAVGGWFVDRAQDVGDFIGVYDKDDRNEEIEGFDLFDKDRSRRDAKAAKDGGYSGELGGELRDNGDGTLHYSGDLGEFDYDPSIWAVCLRETDNGRVPGLRYIGAETDGARIAVPEGASNLDYAFSNRTDITSRPAIPAGASTTGAFNGCTGMTGVTRTDIDTSQGSGVTAEGKVSSDQELYARETGLGTKSTEYGNISYNLFADGGGRMDSSLAGKGYQESVGGEITPKPGDGSKGSKDMLHYSGYLGDFDYDPSQFAVGTRTVVTEDGYAAEVPVLRYVGGKNGDDNIIIPYGVKNMDYMFEGNTKLKQVPVIPEGVESAHAAFANCTKLEQACEGAKPDAHQAEGESVAKGGIVGALGAVGGYAVGGAVAGATAGTVAPGVGHIIGIAGGLLVGGGVGLYHYFTNDGKGGTWTLPNSLKDTSYMFDGCTKLTEAAQFTDESNLMNTQGMYRNNEKLGGDPIANKYGSQAYSDLTGTLVTTDANSHMYEGSNVDYVMDPETSGKSSSQYWDDEAGRFAEGAYENHGASDIAQAEGLSTSLEIEAVLDADVITDLDVASGGSASTGYYWDGNGQKVRTTNANDKNVTDPNARTGTGMDGIIALLDRGAISFAEYKLIGLATGASKGLGGKLLAAGATIGLQLFNVLPKSIKPVVQGVANMVGSDTTIGGLLNSVAGAIPDVGDNSLAAQMLGTAQASSDLDAGISHTADIDLLTPEEHAQKDSSDRTLGAIGDRMQAIMDNPYGADSDAKLSILDGDRINAYMAVNARQMAQDNVFLTAANKSLNDDDFDQMGAMMELSADALEEKLELWKQQDGGALSEEHRRQISEAYMKMLEGLDAYDDAAMEEIRVLYADDPGKLAQAANGLGKTMSASVMPVIESMKEMQEEYGLFSEEQLARMDGLRFAGIKGSAMQYSQGDVTMDMEDAYGWQQTHPSDYEAAQARREAEKAGSAPAAEQAEPVASMEMEEGDADSLDVATASGVVAGAAAASMMSKLRSAFSHGGTEPDAAEGLPAAQADAGTPEAAHGQEKTASARRSVPRTGAYTDAQIAAMEEAARREDADFEAMMMDRLGGA